MGGGGAQQPAQPPPRDIGKETRDSLQAQVDLAPQTYDSEKTFRPLYAQLDTKIMQDQLLGTPDQQGILDLYRTKLQPYMREQSLLDQQTNSELATAQRTADVADVEALGARANAAFRANNPIISELSDQALADVKLRGQLSTEEQRNLDQMTRADFSQRGMARSNPAVVSEFMSRDSVARNKMMQDRQFALTVADKTQDPWLAIVGRPSTQVNSAAGGQGMMGQVDYSLNSGNKMFGMNQGQFANYASQLNSDNFDQANNFSIMSANANSANSASKQQGMMGMIGAGIGAVGTIAAAF